MLHTYVIIEKNAQTSRSELTMYWSESEAHGQHENDLCGVRKGNPLSAVCAAPRASTVMVVIDIGVLRLALARRLSCVHVETLYADRTLFNCQRERHDTTTYCCTFLGVVIQEYCGRTVSPMPFGFGVGAPTVLGER